MVKIRKQDCSGCHACYSGCPKECISMEMDDEGFLYPRIDAVRCIQCGLCERVCAFTGEKEEHIPAVPPVSSAAQCRDRQLLMSSSSGGIFSLLAFKIIDEGGVVFGATWTGDWKVEHSFTETKEGVEAFRGSKYLQSEIGNTFRQAKAFLKEGRKVLFSGTPCQIAGLQSYLRTAYSNLTCVEIACHGVPSPKIWKAYLQDYLEKHHLGNPVYISFRSKTRHFMLGNDSVSLGITYRKGNSIRTRLESLYATSYGSAFQKNSISRPSCLDCRIKLRPSRADISLGDFQGLGDLYPELTPKNGISLVVCRTEKGKQLYESIKNDLSMDRAVPAGITTERNAGLSYHWQALSPRDSFMEKLLRADSEKNLADRLNSSSRPGMVKRAMQRIFKSRLVILKNQIIHVLKRIK